MVTIGDSRMCPHARRRAVRERLRLRGERIKAAREKLGLTRWQLGGRCGTTGTLVARWEEGLTQPATREIWLKLLCILDLRPEDL